MFKIVNICLSSSSSTPFFYYRHRNPFSKEKEKDLVKVIFCSSIRLFFSCIYIYICIKRFIYKEMKLISTSTLLFVQIFKHVNKLWSAFSKSWFCLFFFLSLFSTKKKKRKLNRNKIKNENKAKNAGQII